jgi:hypothetical protein
MGGKRQGGLDSLSLCTLLSYAAEVGFLNHFSLLLITRINISAN